MDFFALLIYTIFYLAISLFAYIDEFSLKEGIAYAFEETWPMHTANIASLIYLYARKSKWVNDCWDIPILMFILLCIVLASGYCG